MNLIVFLVNNSQIESNKYVYIFFFYTWLRKSVNLGLIDKYAMWKRLVNMMLPD